MTRRVVFLFVVLALSLPAVARAQAKPNFAGTWKLNMAKSQLSGTVYTIDKKASGLMHYNGGGFDADFDFTGKEYTMPSGASIAGKELTPTSWELTFRMNGKVISKSKASIPLCSSGYWTSQKAIGRSS